MTLRAINDKLKDNAAILLVLLVSPVYFLTPYNNIKFLAFSILISLILLVGIIYNKGRIVVNKYDYSWAIFIIIGVASFFWSRNGPLMWYFVAGWLCTFIWVIIIRSLAEQDLFVKRFHQLLALIFVFIVFQQFIALCTDVSMYSSDWNKAFSKNRNYTSSYLACLSPFFIFWDVRNNYHKLIKISIFSLFVLLVVMSSARGAFLTLVVVCFAYLYRNRSLRVALYAKYAIVFGLACVLVYSFFFPISGIDIPMLAEFNKVGEESRYFSILYSLKVFVQNPFVGIGMGNWFNEVYQFELGDTNPFNRSNNFMRIDSHNFYSRLLTESGIIGFVLFFIPFGIVLIRMVKQKVLSSYDYTALVSLITFLILIFFYNTSIFSENKFSEIQILAFSSLGLLSSSLCNKVVVKKRTRQISLVIISIISLCLFVLDNVTWNQFQQHKALISQGNIEEGAALLEKAYNPVFNTHYNAETSISHSLALLYKQLDQNNKAKEKFEIAASQSPYNCQLLFDFSNFLYQDLNNVELAKKHLYRLQLIQNKNSRANLLMARVLSHQNQFDEINKYFFKISTGHLYNDRYEYEKLALKLANKALYKNDLALAKKYLHRVHRPLLRSSDIDYYLKLARQIN